METFSTATPEKFVDSAGGTNIDFPNRTFAVWGDSASGDAVRGTSDSGAGVSGTSITGSGVLGSTTSQYGVEGTASGTGSGVYGHTDGPGSGAMGESEGGYGVFGRSGSSHGIYGTTSVGPSAIYGFAVDGYGIQGESASNAGVYGTSRELNGVQGYSLNGTGVYAESANGSALVVKGSIQVQGPAVGRITLPARQESLVVSAPSATTSSLILLTPQGNPHGYLWVTPGIGSFTIHSSSAHPTDDVLIAYLVIN